MRDLNPQYIYINFYSIHSLTLIILFLFKSRLHPKFSQVQEARQKKLRGTVQAPVSSGRLAV